MGSHQVLTEIEHSQGIGGRFALPKSPLYEQAMMRIEGRTNQYTARYMLLGDLAFVLSAVELGLTPPEIGKKLVGGLLELIPEAENLARSDTRGDIVLQREVWVANKLGRDVAVWLHLGRHRAESLRGYLPRMFLRDALFREREALVHLIETLLTVAEGTDDIIAPVFHHLQHAGHTTLAEYLISWASNLTLHLDRYKEVEARLDYAPPTLTGRPDLLKQSDLVWRRLGFSRVQTLRQQLHVTEDHFAEPFSALMLTNVALARLAEDLRLYTTSEFEFFELSDRHSSGSSALPQKKNAFCLQLIIGGAKIGAGRLAAQLATSITVSEEADSVYHAGSLYQHALDIIQWTDLMAEIVAEGQFKFDELQKKSAFGYAGAGEAQDILIFEYKLPPRTAHHHLGRALRLGIEAGNDPAVIRQSLKETLKGTVDEARLTDVIIGDIVPETALYKSGVVQERARVKKAVAAAKAELAQGNPYAKAEAALIAEGKAFLESR